MLAGGVEAPLAPLTFGAFALIKAMSTRNDCPGRASRPFDAARDGFVMGEGACIVVLESLAHARRRGADVLGEVVGYALTNDAHHMTAPRPDGKQAARTIRLALADAGLKAYRIGYVNAHGSSTVLGDAAEAQAIRTGFGRYLTPQVLVSATKGLYGHPLSTDIHWGRAALSRRPSRSRRYTRAGSRPPRTWSSPTRSVRCRWCRPAG